MQPNITIRRFLRQTDEAKLKEWLAADPVHTARYGDRFTTDEGIELYTVEADGEPVFFLRLSRVLRVEMQFPPKKTSLKIKIARCLRKGLYVLAASAKHNGFAEMVFETDSEKLRNYCKGLGFAESDYLTIPLVKR